MLDPRARQPARVRGALALLLAVCLLTPLAASAQNEEPRWYDGTLRGFEYGFDLVFIRPAAAVTLAAGAGLFIPAAVMTSPGGRETIEEAWELFVVLPGRNLWGKPLGEI